MPLAGERDMVRSLGEGVFRGDAVSEKSPPSERPVLLGAILIAQQASDGVAPKTHQLRKTVAAPTGKGLRGSEAIGTLKDQALDLFEEGRVFFRSMGLGGTWLRERMRWPLSAMVH